MSVQCYVHIVLFLIWLVISSIYEHENNHSWFNFEDPVLDPSHGPLNQIQADKEM